MAQKEPPFEELSISSRWNIPLAWWLFFKEDSLQPYKVSSGKSNWLEWCFVCEWEEAKKNFNERSSLLRSFLNDSEQGDYIKEFLDGLHGISQKYIHISPEEILESPEAYSSARKILYSLDASEVSVEEKLSLLAPYTGKFVWEKEIDKKTGLFGYGPPTSESMKMDFFYAVWDDDLPLAKELLKNYACLNDYHEDVTPLYGAIENCSLKCLNFLLEQGVDVELEIRGCSPLMRAIDVEITASTEKVWDFGNIDNDDLRPVPVLSERLLNYGADPNRRDSSGFTPLEAAEKRGHLSFLDLCKK